MEDKMRARLGPASKTIAGKTEVLGPAYCDENILAPLWKTRGVVWPYTPDIMFGASAEYNNFHFTHSNYPYQNYVKSMPAEITVVGMFTAQTVSEARYVLAVIHFLRAMTMIEFGDEAAKAGRAGTPPPVLRFNYMGDHQFNNVPVVVSTVNYQLERDIDYVSVPGPNNTTSYVPTSLNMTVTLLVQQNPSKVRKEFDLAKFKTGDLLSKGFL
jgi:hypothetical protein